MADIKKPVSLSDSDFEQLNDSDFEGGEQKLAKPDERTREQKYGTLRADNSDFFGNLYQGVMAQKNLASESLKAGASMGLYEPKVTAQKSLMGEPINASQMIEPITELAYNMAGSFVSGEALGTVASAANRMTGNILPRTAAKIGSRITELVKKIPVSESIKKGADFADRIQKVFWQAKSGTSGFGKEIENKVEGLIAANPDKVINATRTFQTLNAEAAFNPQVKSVIEGIPELKTYIDNPTLSEKMTLKEARRLKTAIGKRIPQGKWDRTVSMNPNDIPVADAWDSLKGDILEAFPDMADINKAYSSKLRKYNSLRRAINGNNMFENIKKNWSNPQMQRNMLEMFDGDVIAELQGYQDAKNAVKWGKRAIGAVGIGAAGAVGVGAAKGR